MEKKQVSQLPEKKEWQKPRIAAELSVDKTLKGTLAGDGGTMS
jgi:hypothetical protein